MTNLENSLISATHLSPTAIIKVRGEIVLIMDATKEGVVYFKLSKNMFRVRLILFFIVKDNKDKCKFLPDYVRSKLLHLCLRKNVI